MRFVRKLRMGAWTHALLIPGAAMGLAFGTAPALAAPPAADAEPVHSPAATGGADVGETYWTPERMASAIPVPVPVLPSSSAQTKLAPVARGVAGQVNPAAAVGQPGSGAGETDPVGATAQQWTGSRTSPPATTSGKVFFVGDDGLDYVCTGSTVNSGGKNLVYTAGHCVNGGGSTRKWFAANTWTFVPDYDATNSNQRPYGTWTARQLWSLNGWTQNADRRYDIGVAVMQTDSSGQHIANVVGSQGIEWNYPLVQFVYQFGYPQRSPFNGATLQYCTGTTYDDQTNEGIDCNMTEGASGGPWLDDFGGTLGRLDSVNSWVFWNSNGVRYKWNGPYFGEASHSLYTAVQNL